MSRPANTRVCWMAIEGMDGEEKWHLGEELREEHRRAASRAAVSRPEPETDPSAQVLERPLYVLTVEHLSYFLIAAWTVATRLLALGRRPLTPAEAIHALFDLNLAPDLGAGSQPHSVPMHLVQAWLFGAFGADDYVARLGFALGGVLLVALAFALRRPLGRVGAIVLAMLLAISPSMTYFSRSAVSPVPALALTLAAITLFFAMVRRPTFLRSLAAAVVTALALASDPTTYVTAAIFALATVVFVVWSGFVDDTYFERVRYWWVRHGITAALAVAIGIVVWLLFGGGVWRADGVGAAKASGGVWAAYRQGIDFYLPIFALYEFLPMLLALAGVVLFVSFRLRSRFAGWCFIWAIGSLAIFLLTPARAAEVAPAILLPMAMLGALTVDYLVRGPAWQIVRYPLIFLAALTIYVALIVNFCFDLPDGSEAAWARHALLFWSEPATTVQTRTEAKRLRRVIGGSEKGQGGGIYFVGDAPALQWYLRDLPTTAQAGGAAAIVAADANSHEAQSSAGAQTTTFEFQDRWTPEFRGSSPGQVFRYLFTQRAWGPVTTNEAAFILTAPSATPTPLATPTPAMGMAVPSASPTPTPTPSSSPSAEPEAALSGSPSATATSSAAETETPAASPTPTASPGAQPSPSSEVSANATPSAVATPTANATATPGATETPGVPSPTITPAATPATGGTEGTTTATPGAMTSAIESPMESPTESPQPSPTPSASATP